MNYPKAYEAAKELYEHTIKYDSLWEAREPDFLEWIKINTKLKSNLASIEAESEEESEAQQFMTDVHNWADKTFGTERTALAPLYHLKKEVDEAIKSMQQGIRENAVAELSDCFILILNASSKYRMTFDELLKASKNKMEINKSRKWGNPDNNGVVEHLKQ